MRGQHDHSPEHALFALARRQHGAVSRAQVRATGLSDDAINRRLRGGRLRPVHRGVYAVGPLPLTSGGNRMAAILACGGQAVLSHRTAADLWGLRPCDTPRIEVTVPRSGRRACTGLTIHRSTLDPRDATHLDAFPVTTWPRTLLDLAEVVPPDNLTRALERADEKRLFDLPALEAVIARHPHRHGAARLARALERYRPTPFTRSKL
ncbi:MAG TPA: type IV toxin-antitoxin system AbiEi family antitoxin domain-containing protein, partial [Solirubrobacteraceae bacterium]|nr:type IV toxin-antitoxin system AbiEi family antitoxin domain-containing protein [Solirubrobacteraceae bacterium]